MYIFESKHQIAFLVQDCVSNMERSKATRYKIRIKTNYRIGESINPFHTNPLAVVCGMGEVGEFRSPPPLKSQHLMGLEGCFFAQCASIKDRKKNFENRSKNKT